jgi:deoxycytidylate deaminase
MSSINNIKLSFIVHAEMNAIYNATYSGVSLDGSTIFIHGLPACSECAKGIIQVGIKRVIVSKQCIENKPHWNDSWNKSKAMFAEAGIAVFVIDEKVTLKKVYESDDATPENIDEIIELNKIVQT